MVIRHNWLHCSSNELQHEFIESNSACLFRIF